MMAPNLLASLLPPNALPIGLGCSRLGSIAGPSAAVGRALLAAALAGGVRVFDTSNLYGQGDSERWIGQALGRRDDCIVCSKAGKYLGWNQRALLPLKGVLRSLAMHSASARQGVARARARPMPTCWDTAFLIRSLHASLRRLDRPRIEVFLLHSPDAEVLRHGEAIDALERARIAGKIGLIGASVDDVAAAEAALRDPRVRVLQLPLRPGETAFDSVAAQAAAAGVAVIAREILGGLGPAQAPMRIAAMIRRPEVALTLIGTTSLSNLRAGIDAATRGDGP